MHFASFDKMDAFCRAYLAPYQKEPLHILDVGSAAVERSSTYREIFARPPWRYVGADIAAARNVDVVLNDPYDWRELDDQEFDVVVSGQAFEHIEYVWLTILEIARVLKTNGLAVLIAPSRGHVHRHPVDCWRFYPDGLPALARYAGLETLESHVQQAMAYPGRIQWGDAVLIARRPQRSVADEAACTARNWAAKLTVKPNLKADELGAPRFTPAARAASVIAPANGLDAIGARERERIAALSGWRVRAAISWRHLRRAWDAIYRPFAKLTQV